MVAIFNGKPVLVEETVAHARQLGLSEEKLNQLVGFTEDYGRFIASDTLKDLELQLDIVMGFRRLILYSIITQGYCQKQVNNDFLYTVGLSLSRGYELTMFIHSLESDLCHRLMKLYIEKTKEMANRLNEPVRVETGDGVYKGTLYPLYVPNHPYLDFQSHYAEMQSITGCINPKVNILSFIKEP